jgi:hypothetical protein
VFSCPFCYRIQICCRNTKATLKYEKKLLSSTLLVHIVASVSKQYNYVEISFDKRTSNKYRVVGGRMLYSKSELP